MTGWDSANFGRFTAHRGQPAVGAVLGLWRSETRADHDVEHRAHRQLATARLPGVSCIPSSCLFRGTSNSCITSGDRDVPAAPRRVSIRQPPKVAVSKRHDTTRLIIPESSYIKVRCVRYGRYSTKRGERDTYCCQNLTICMYVLQLVTMHRSEASFCSEQSCRKPSLPLHRPRRHLSHRLLRLHLAQKWSSELVLE